MKLKIFLGLLLSSGLSVTGSALADPWHGGYHGRAHVGVGVVINPYWGPWYVEPGYYPGFYPRTIVIERQLEPVYVQQRYVQQASSPVTESALPAAPAENYWHYCAESKNYYPYVKECPAGWQKVSPQPPSNP